MHQQILTSWPCLLFSTDHAHVDIIGKQRHCKVLTPSWGRVFTTQACSNAIRFYFHKFPDMIDGRRSILCKELIVP